MKHPKIPSCQNDQLVTLIIIKLLHRKIGNAVIDYVMMTSPFRYQSALSELSVKRKTPKYQV